MFSIVLKAPLGPCSLTTALKVTRVFHVIIVMLLKGHHNLLTCLNEVPATVDINYVHLVAVLSRRKHCLNEAGCIPLVGNRFPCCLQMLGQ